MIKSIFTLNLFVMVMLYSCRPGQHDGQEAPSYVVDSTLVKELFVVDTHQEKSHPFRIDTSYSIDLNGDDVRDQVILYGIEHWEDPGEFQKIRIEMSGKAPYDLLNYDGWVSFNSNYPVSKKIAKQNELDSQILLVIEVAPGKKVVIVFGWVYASEPGLVTIIDPENQSILFNKGWQLLEISDNDSDGYLELYGSSVLGGNIEMIDFAKQQIALTQYHRF
ncbi:MAG: hypothetical protein AAFO69_06845 [Bacteroidota bacterium]